jgi:hypothetical protein
MFPASAVFSSLKSTSCLHCIVTNSVEQSPPWETNGSSASQEILRILWNWRLNAAFTTARHLSPSGAKLVQSTPSRPFSLRVILIISSHVRLAFQKISFSQVALTKTLHAFFSSPNTCHMPSSYDPWFDHPNNIWWRVQIMCILVMQFSAVWYSLSVVYHGNITELL